MHFGGDDCAGENTTADGNEAGEGAFFVDICSLNSSLWRPKPQSNIFVPSSSSLSHTLALRTFDLGVEEDMGLLLEGTLRLDCQFGRHGGGLN